MKHLIKKRMFEAENKYSKKMASFTAIAPQCGAVGLLSGLSNTRCLYFLFLILTIFSTACQQGELKPADLLPEDMCAHCKMAISEKRYAAEFITKDGEAFKFDDIGCMVNFVKSKSNRENISGFFVMDYETKQWMRGETAFFVHSPEFKTPMSGNIVAFLDNTRAGRHAGEPRTFAEVMSGTN